MRILIAGGAGFIGSNLCLSLVRDGHEVYIIDDGSTGKNLEEVKRIAHKTIEVNIANDYIDVPKQFENLDVVFNLVGRVSHTGSMKFPLVDLESNTKAPLRVLNLIKDCAPNAIIVYTGTRGQYGQIQYTPVDENHPINPVDINGINKHAAEQYHVLYAKQYGMTTFSLRLTNIFGPRHQTQTPDGVLNWFITQAIKKQPITIYGGKRDVLYVDECVDALKACVTIDKSLSGSIFNLGGRMISLEDFVKTLVEIEPTEWKLIEKEYKLEIGDYLANAEKFKKASGWELSNISLRDMILNTVNYYKIGAF